MGDQDQTKRPGGLNLNFDGGKVTLDHIDGDTFVSCVEQTADENILVLARSVRSGGFNLSQFTPKGILDSTFTNGFYADPDFPDRDKFHLLENGSFLVTGGAHPEQLAVTRFDKHGKLDTTYGQEGHAIVKVCELEFEGHKSVRIQTPENPKVPKSPDPRLDQVKRLPPKVGNSVSIADGNSLYLVFTVRWDEPEIVMPVVVRLDENGELDKTFNKSGYVVVTLAGAGIRCSQATEAVLQTQPGEDSKLLIILKEILPPSDPSESQRLLVRYNNRGEPDYSFGDSAKQQGVVSIDRDDFYVVNSLWTDETGALKVLGASFKDNIGLKGAIAGYTAQGKQDSSFNEGQLLLTEIGPGYGNWHKGAFYGQGQGLRMVLSTSFVGNEPLIGIARLLDGGAFDDSFGDQGKAVFAATESGWQALAQLQLLPNKDIILGYRNDIWWVLGGDAE